MHRLLLSGIWPQIKKLSKQAHHVQAAVAYVTSNAYLLLKNGDTLVVNASHHTIKTGGTSAKVLWKWHRAGVKLFTSDRLHAKLIVMDNLVMVRSANASILSAEQLNEAATLTDSPTIVSQARSFIYQLAKAATPLTEDRLLELAAIKVQRPQMSFKRRRKRYVAQGDTTWVVSTQDLDDDKYADEQHYVERAEKELRKTHPDAAPYSIRWTRRGGLRDRAQNGDYLIVHASEKDHSTPYEVRPPSTLLKRQNGLKWTRFYYDPDLVNSQLLKDAGIRTKLGTNSTIPLSFHDAMELQRLWPRKRRRKS
jgi:hypothetical protein